MGYEFYTNMQKRGDGLIYADLHKTDEKIYFSAEEAQAAIQANPDLAPHRHVVTLIAQTESDWALQGKCDSTIDEALEKWRAGTITPQEAMQSIANARQALLCR